LKLLRDAVARENDIERYTGFEANCNPSEYTGNGTKGLVRKRDLVLKCYIAMKILAAH
jgi:hypothetical protein